MILPPSQRPAAPFRFRPTNQDELWNMAMMLHNGDNRKAHEAVLCYAQFGHHFDFDLGRLMGQAYVLKHKAALQADASAGICRNSGLVRFLIISSWDETHCTCQVARTDEPDDVIHEFTYTRQMAEMQGLTRNRNWDTMPKQMCRVRALTMALRAVFPEVVSGIYSVDEIADNTPMDDYERAMITAESIGEELKLDSNRPTPAPAPAPEPAPTPAPTPAASINDVCAETEQKKSDDVEYSHVTTPTPYNQFATIDDIKAACEHNAIPWPEVVQCAQRLGVSIEHLSEVQKQAFFYTWCLSHNLRNSALLNGWQRNLSEARHVFKALKKEFKSLVGIENRRIGAMLGRASFWEAAKVSAAYTGESLNIARAELKELAKSQDHKPMLAARLASLG